MTKPAINRDAVSGEALFILQSLRENGRLGRSNKLADVKSALEPSVSLEFDSYFFFLRKFHYIAMDREAQLRLTEQGERVVEGEAQLRFVSEVEEFFAEQLGAEADASSAGSQDEPLLPPPPPSIVLDEQDMMAPPPQSVPPLPAATPPPMPSAGGRARRAASSSSPEPSTPAPAPAPVAPPVEVLVAAEPPRPAPAPAAASFPVVTAPLTATASMAPPASVPQTATPASAASKGAELDLRYQKFDPLGTGPLGTVFKGRFNPLGLDICIKELKDIFGYFSFLQRGEVLKRLKKELCAQAQVRHPAIIQVLDQNMDAARPYFVLELLRGSLRERLEAGAGKGVPVSFALRCFLQVAYGLRAAHEAGLTHHNLKPENVLFDAYGNAKLADFGLGRVVEMDATKGMPQVFVGTGGMVYMASELIHRTGKEAGPAADVYGLGILLYEMLTGQIPGRRSPLPSEVNSDAPVEMDAIFDKMTQDRVEQRYPDIDALLEDFYKAFPDKEYLGRGDLVLSSELQQ